MPTEPKIKRIVAFVDGQALFYAARKVFGYQRVNYDVAALSQAVCKQQGWNLAQTRFYTGIPSQKKNRAGHTFWIQKLMEMRRQGVDVFSRELKYKEITTRQGGNIESTVIPREKGVDIRIALDIVKLAHEKAYDIALIFSQDQDFSEVVADVAEIAKRQVRSIGIVSAFPCSPEAPNKRGIYGTSWLDINRATYDACLDTRDYSPPPIAVNKPDVQSDEDRFLEALDANCEYLPREFAKHILMHAKMRMGKITWKGGRQSSDAVWLIQHGELWLPMLVVTSDGLIKVPASNKTVRRVVRNKELKVSLLQKLNLVPGVSIPETDFAADHYIPLEKLLNLDAVDVFFDAIDWWIAELKKLPVVEEEKAEE